MFEYQYILAAKIQLFSEITKGNVLFVWELGRFVQVGVAYYMLDGVLICLGWVVSGIELLSFEFLILEFLGFELGVDNGTDEGIEAIITLALACLWVNWCVSGATLKLGVETLLSVSAFGFVVEFGVGLLAGLFETVVVL